MIEAIAPTDSEDCPRPSRLYGHSRYGVRTLLPTNAEVDGNMALGSTERPADNVGASRR